MQEVQGEKVNFRVGDRVRFTGMSTERMTRDGIYTVGSWFETGGRRFIALQGNGCIVNPDKLVLVEKPEVHSGGPYVCTSVYENMVNQRDVAIEAVAAHQKEIKSLRGDVDILKKIVADLKMERRQKGEELNALRDHVWAVTQQAAKEVENLKKQVSDTEKPPLPQPPPPPWLRPGWWYAMDNDGEWYAYQTKPSINEDEYDWTGGTHNLRIPGMLMGGHDIPEDRWREACWQVSE